MRSDRGVILYCGSEHYRWKEAPPTFVTHRGDGAEVLWENQGLIARDVLGTPIYLYNLKRVVSEAALSDATDTDESVTLVPDPDAGG